MKQNYSAYGVFVNSNIYHSFDTFDEASDYFDSCVALGIAEHGMVVGWYSTDDYIELYDYREVFPTCKS